MLKRIKFSGYKYSYGCRRFDIRHSQKECIPDKSGCIGCLCTSCEHSTGFCLARCNRYTRLDNINVSYCFYYKSINPVNDGDIQRKKHDYRSPYAPPKS